MGFGIVHRRRALLAEFQPPVGVGGAVLEVIVGGGRSGPSPRVGAHELRVGIDGEVDLATGRGGQLEPDQGSPLAVREEVGAPDGQPVRSWYLHPDETIAAGEASGLAQPLSVYAEPQSIEEFDRRAPYPAHLPLDVPAHCRKTPDLGAHDLTPAPRRHVAPVIMRCSSRKAVIFG